MAKLTKNKLNTRTTDWCNLNECWILTDHCLNNDDGFYTSKEFFSCGAVALCFGCVLKHWVFLVCWTPFSTHSNIIAAAAAANLNIFSLIHFHFMVLFSFFLLIFYLWEMHCFLQPRGCIFLARKYFFLDVIFLTKNVCKFYW